MNLHLARLIGWIIVYLDNCCYGRRFDIKTHPKVNAEAARIRLIIRNRIRGGYVIIGSFAVAAEIGQITDAKRRMATERYYKRAVFDEVKKSAPIIARAQGLESNGLGKMDAAHLAAAEDAGAGFLLTTDANFIRICAKKNLTTVKVINPLDF